MIKPFRIEVVPTKDKTGYIAKWANYSFWARERADVIAQMLFVIDKLQKQAS